MADFSTSELFLLSFFTSFLSGDVEGESDEYALLRPLLTGGEEFLEKADAVIGGVGCEFVGLDPLEKCNEGSADQKWQHLLCCFG